MCLAQGHNAVTSVRLKPATPVSSQALYRCIPDDDDHHHDDERHSLPNQLIQRYLNY